MNSKHNSLGAFGKRIKAKSGSGIAVKATARKIAVLYYRLFAEGLIYVEEGVKKYEEKLREKQMKYLSKMAEKFNLQLVHS